MSLAFRSSWFTRWETADVEGEWCLDLGRPATDDAVDDLRIRCTKFMSSLLPIWDTTMFELVAGGSTGRLIFCDY